MCALLAVGITVEIIIIIIAIYFRDGDFSEKLTSIGLFVLTMPLVYGRQFYLSDLTSPPAFVQVYYPPVIQQIIVISLALMTLNTFSKMLSDLTGKTLDDRIKEALKG